MVKILPLVALSLIVSTHAGVLPDVSEIRAKEKTAELTSYINNNDGTGSYDFSFGTSNGQYREESGKFISTDGNQTPHLVVRGSYSYLDDSEKLIVVNYIADENGYRILPNDDEETGIVDISLPNGVVASLLG